MCVIFAAVSASAQETPQAIQAGFTVERELGSTEKHKALFTAVRSASPSSATRAAR
jgi:hypothetical protein